jgi:hypothetical protein
MNHDGTPILDTISALRQDRDCLQDIINSFAVVDWKLKHEGSMTAEVPTELIQRCRTVYNTQRR